MQSIDLFSLRFMVTSLVEITRYCRSRKCIEGIEALGKPRFVQFVWRRALWNGVACRQVFFEEIEPSRLGPSCVPIFVLLRGLLCRDYEVGTSLSYQLILVWKDRNQDGQMEGVPKLLRILT